jgi:hypothetical protein
MDDYIKDIYLSPRAKRGTEYIAPMPKGLIISHLDLKRLGRSASHGHGYTLAHGQRRQRTIFSPMLFKGLAISHLNLRSLGLWARCGHQPIRIEGH